MAIATVYVDVVIHKTVVLEVEYDVEDLSGSEEQQEEQILDLVSLEDIAMEADIDPNLITDWDIDDIEMEEYNTEEDTD